MVWFLDVCTHEPLSISSNVTGRNAGDTVTLEIGRINWGEKQVTSVNLESTSAESNFVENFNYTELITRWTIDQDVDRGYRLRLWDYAGYPLPPQYLLSTTPNMLPKTRLREVAIDPDTLLTQRKRSVDLTKRGAGEHGRRELGYREENAAESWFRTALDKIFGGSSQKDE